MGIIHSQMFTKLILTLRKENQRVETHSSNAHPGTLSIEIASMCNLQRVFLKDTMCTQEP